MEQVTPVRTPISVSRIPIQNNRLEWDEVYEKFVNYIKFASSSTYNQFQTESAEDLFQEGQLVLYRCWLLYGNKGWDDFTPMFKASLWRRLREFSGKKRHFTVDFDTLIECGAEPGEEKDLDADIDEKMRFQKLTELLADQPVALTILKEFVSPGDRTLWECQMEYARKEMMKSQNRHVIVPSSVQPTPKVIRRGMEISIAKFDQHFAILKDAMRQVYGDVQR